MPDVPLISCATNKSRTDDISQLTFLNRSIYQVLATAFIASIVVFLLGATTGNYSWVDKSWSILPVYYAWIIAFHTVRAGAEIHPRLAIMLGLISFWGVRLSYNFWRKGGYALRGEDYRWPIIKAQMHPILFQAFNLIFVAFIQNILLAALLSPMYVAWKAAYGPGNALAAPLNEIDIAAIALTTSFLLLEAIADQQQWNFQVKKHAAIASRKRLSGPLAKGYLDTGIWRYSRHPNFFAEQAFWCAICVFAGAATKEWAGWWLGGAVALVALFQGSTWLTEKISAGKYPAYATYKKTTSRFVPWFPGREPTPTAAPPGKVAEAVAVVQEVVAVEEAPAPVAEAVLPARRGRASVASRKSTDKPASSSRSRSAPRKAAKSKGEEKPGVVEPEPTSGTKVTKKVSTGTKKATAAQKVKTPAAEPSTVVRRSTRGTARRA